MRVYREGMRVWYRRRISMQKKNPTSSPSAKHSLLRNSTRWVAVSGGFDPIHIGHVRMFREARKLGDKLVVILNNDKWLIDKKGYAFMPEKERAELIAEFPFVDRVFITEHRAHDTDRSVSRELAKLKPAIFANGGDRKKVSDIPESTVCREFRIKMVFRVGKGGKVQSSSWLVDAAIEHARSKRQP